MFFRNLHIKIFSLVLAILFWIFVVSLENTFYQFPAEIPIQIFNLGPELANSGSLPGVKLTLRAQDASVLKRLAASDFEAYVDLSRVGVGVTAVPVSVTVRNPLVSVTRVAPESVIVTIEPVREKQVNVKAEVLGHPEEGVRVDRSLLSQNAVTVRGAESVLAKIASAKAEVALLGNEKEDIVKPAAVHLFDQEGKEIAGLTVEDEVTATVYFSEVEATKIVGVRAKITGSVTNGVVKKIEVNPAVVTISALREALAQIEMVETESVDVSAAPGSFEKKALLVLPLHVTVSSGQSKEVTVKVEIEKSL